MLDDIIFYITYGLGFLALYYSIFEHFRARMIKNKYNRRMLMYLGRMLGEYSKEEQAMLLGNAIFCLAPFLYMHDIKKPGVQIQPIIIYMEFNRYARKLRLINPLLIVAIVLLACTHHEVLSLISVLFFIYRLFVNQWHYFYIGYRIDEVMHVAAKKAGKGSEDEITKFAVLTFLQETMPLLEEYSQTIIEQEKKAI